MMFGGKTFDYHQDYARLKNSLDRVAWLMADGQPRTLREIARATGSSEAGVSARLRDLRKPGIRELYDVRSVESDRGYGGIWQYRVILGIPVDKQQQLF